MQHNLSYTKTILITEETYMEKVSRKKLSKPVGTKSGGGRGWGRVWPSLSCKVGEYPCLTLLAVWHSQPFQCTEINRGVVDVYLARRCTRYEYLQWTWHRHRDILGMNKLGAMYLVWSCTWQEDVLGINIHKVQDTKMYLAWICTMHLVWRCTWYEDVYCEKV